MSSRLLRATEFLRGRPTDDLILRIATRVYLVALHKPRSVRNIELLK